MTSGMVSSSSLPDRPSRRGGLAAAALAWSAGRCSLTRISPRYPVFGCAGPKPALSPLVALICEDAFRPSRSNYRSLMSAGSGCLGEAPLAPKNPAKTDIFVAIAPFQRSPIAARRDIDENRGLPYKPRNCPRWPGFPRGRLIWGRKWPILGRPASPDLPQFSGKIAAAKLPGQRRTTREADLSTQQTGAQAPHGFPCPSCHDRRPQGSRRAPCAWPQASERLNRVLRKPSWIG